jgi:hypothetical protein
MSPKIFIPIIVTLTETEYLILDRMMKDLCMDDKQQSAAVRLIIREWDNLKSAKNKPPNPSESDDEDINPA